MKFFTEKSLGYKIVIAIVIVVLFNFAAPTISSAGIGGILFAPIKDLLLVIADGIISITQSVLFKMDSSFLTIEHNKADWSEIGGWAFRNIGWGWSYSGNCFGSNNRRS